MSKIALLVGINYFGTESELNGCLNDIKTINKYLIEKLKFKDENIIKLTDDNQNYDLQPTKNNILNNLNNIIKKIKENNIEEFFLFYSGHGSSINDTNGDERDGKDEILIPVDYMMGNIIKDDDINNILENIPEKCKVFGLFDCCNSGTIMDLKYLFKANKNNVIENNLNNLDKKNNIIMISGCRDDQTSADFFNRNRNQYAGALTTSFINSCDKLKNDNIKFSHLLYLMRLYLKNGKFTQIPQISSNKKLDNNSFYVKNSKMLIQYKPPTKPPTPQKPQTTRRRRFKNRRQYILYLRRLAYLRYLYKIRKMRKRR